MKKAPEGDNGGGADLKGQGASALGGTSEAAAIGETKTHKTYYLKETATAPLDATVAPNLKYRCLGGDCSKSCCYNLIARVFIHEVIALAKYFPIVFFEMESDDGSRDISLCIFLKIDRENNHCTYLRKGVGCDLQENRPLACKQYPFIVAKDADGENKMFIRPSCEGVSMEAGSPIFTPDGQFTPDVRQECIDHAIRGAAARDETRQFVDTLIAHNLIVDGMYDYKGVAVHFKLVDLQKLIALPKETLAEFKRKGYLGLIDVQTDSIIDNCNRHIDAYLERMTGNLPA